MFNASRRSFLQTGSLLTVASSMSILLPASVMADDEGNAVVAETTFGKVEGVTQSGVNVFKGIPYGADTGGVNRFKPPQDPAPWAGIRSALEYGPSAPQSNPAGSQGGRGAEESEDCLVLNIWSRGLNDGRKRPVMFWIHGGGFRSGSGSSPQYDGTNLCLRGDVVVVAINHRLNCLGFTHFAQIGGDEYASSGNVGLLDIVHALRWVKNNIEQFGGDPDRVMIFGESGGGRKVAALLGMPAAKGLFHRAVIESGATLRVAEPDTATQLAGKFLQTVGLNKNNFAKIHELPLTALLSAFHATAPSTLGAGFQPVHDGVVLPYHPFYPGASPVNPDVPLIIGATRTEMTLFARPDDFNLTDDGIRERIDALVGKKNSQTVLNTYRAANPSASPIEIYFLVLSDHNYVMASITIAERRAALQAAPVYLYYLTWASPVNDGRLMSPHTLDIPFVFDNVRTNRLTRDNASAIPLAEKISDTWIAFARTGNPNSDKLPNWKPFTEKQRDTLVLNNTSQLMQDPLAERRKLMQRLVDL